MKRRLLVLGAGYAGSVAARRGRVEGREVLVTVRSEERAAALRAEGFAVLRAPALDAGIARHLDAGTDVVIAFQPDPATDQAVAGVVHAARSVVYVSSTGVYGNITGHIDDTTPLPPVADERARRILDAEARYVAVGATVLRCPGIYGPDRGLHVRVLRGEHRLPGEGAGYLSRIHVDDLAAFALAAGDAPRDAVAGRTFVVGDEEPARQIDVVRFVCGAYGAPLPPSVPEASVHVSLRADRRVDASRARGVLGVTLRHPTYREGMAPAATGLTYPLRAQE